MSRVAIVFVLVCGLVGCNTYSAESSREPDLAGGEASLATIDNGRGSGSGGSGQTTPSVTIGLISTAFTDDLADADALQRKIIYTADVSLVVEEFDGIDERIDQLIRDANGYKSSVAIRSNTGQSRNGTWAARIPTDRYDEFLKDLANLGVPESVQQQTDDVTMRFIDIEARLETKRELETRIRELVAEREGKIADVMEAERELARVRGEIESMEGELRFLTNQTALSTVTIRVREERDYVPPQAPSFGGRIAQTWAGSLTSLRQTGQALLLAVVAFTPWLGVLLVILLPVVFLWRARRRRPAT